MNITNEQLRQIIKEELAAVLDEKRKKKKKKKKKGKKDACYRKVRSRYDVWPSAYASGALVKCRKVGAKNWGNSKKNESLDEEFIPGGESSKYGQITVDEMIQGIAEEHGVDPEQIRSEFEMGVEEEMEHAEEELIAQEIALDHLVEDPEYYTKLEDANLEESLNLQEDAALDRQILARSDYKRGLLNFIEQNPGTTSDEMFNSDVANAIIPIGIRKRAIILWIKQLIKDGYITSKRYKLYTTGKASWNNHNVVTEKKKRKLAPNQVRKVT